LAAQLCEKVNVYGFGVNNVGGKEVAYHYYKGYAARKFGTDVHTFETETFLIEALHELGLLKLCKYDADEVARNRRGFEPQFLFCGRD